MISVTLGTFALLLANVDFNATLIGLVLVLLNKGFEPER